MTFLSQRDPRPVAVKTSSGELAASLFLGPGAMGLEVVVLEPPSAPAIAELRQIHAQRTGRRAAPVVLVALWGTGRAAICSPLGDDTAVHQDLDATQVERLCDVALSAADRHAAIRFLTTALGQRESPIPGLRNAGLFALHELEAGVPTRADWQAASSKARGALSARGRALIERLGYGIQDLAGPAAVLTARDTDVAIAVFLEREDEIEPVNPRFDNQSPISYGLWKADQKNLDYVVVSAGSVLRVYPVKPQVGTGRRGRTETYVELNLALLAEQQSAYLWLLCSADALRAGGSFEEILARSADYAAELGARLRDRVYEEVVPRLAQALWKARRLRAATTERLAETYEMALLVLFRLLFVAYAEDKELLPLHTHAEYRRHSLKELARRIADAVAKGTPWADGDFYWTEVSQLWKAIDGGNPGWGVPAYNGGLFSEDKETRPAAHALRGITLSDQEFGPALAALVLDETAEGGSGPVDFRSLGVREFGTIYEGLLESELSVAETDLAVDQRTGAFLPAKGKARVEVPEGTVYLHDRSGARKSTGAYYTKDFAVDHLLDHALEPALRDHLARLDARYDDRSAAERLFKFHVADIAMGSGHFLVAAIDRIERAFQGYLAKRPLAGVSDELERLRQSAAEQLGEEWAGDPIEDTQLLRRQIARRCVFGVDLNPLAVELARLSVWIHTFVPGLPLSFLDHNLVVGNSLVGIATFDEASDLLLKHEGVDESKAQIGDLFTFSAEERLGRAREPMEKLARLADATAAEVKQAKALYERARAAIRDEEALLTVLTASRIDASVQQAVTQGQVATKLESQSDVFSDALVRKAERALAGLKPLHFPIVFPQVFLGGRGGFDAIVGNPPWEKERVEELEFWGRHAPGIRGVGTAERERRLQTLRRERVDLVTALQKEKDASEVLRDLLRGFPGMNTGHPDLFRAFTWRFYQLLSQNGGRLGVVLPGDAFKIKGATPLREVLAQSFRGIDFQPLTNRGHWVFEEVDVRKLIALVIAEKGTTGDGATYHIRSEVHSQPQWNRRVQDPVARPLVWLRDYSPALVLPTITVSKSLDLVNKFMRWPRMKGHRSFPVWRVYADLETTRDRDLYTKKRAYGSWPVYKGESFDLWTPDTGEYFAFAAGREVAAAVHERRARAGSNSPYGRTPDEWRKDPTTHPTLFPRIAFRDVTNRTNRRTLITALIPPRVVTTQTAPWVLWQMNDHESHEALLLGILSSIPMDWWVRRFVEGHVDEEAFNCLRVPDVNLGGKLEKRLVAGAGTLASQDERFADWAATVGFQPRKVKDDEQAEIVAELDAIVAHLYGLSEADLRHIFETFHEGWDYEERLRATLRHYEHLKSIPRS